MAKVQGLGEGYLRQIQGPPGMTTGTGRGGKWAGIIGRIFSAGQIFFSVYLISLIA